MNKNNRLKLILLAYLVFALPVKLLFSASAHADLIAISVPLSGDAAELGKNFRTGVKLAAEQLELKHNLYIADDGCDPDLAVNAGKEVIKRGSAIVIGLLCNEPSKIIASQIVDSGIPIVINGAQSIRLIKDREREGWNLWRMAPGDDYPVEIAANAIAGLWKETPFAIVDDGTIYGRSFTDQLRQSMQERGLEPQFSDTFRAAQSTQAGLLRRLQRSGVTAAFIASATVEDLFTIARNMTELGIDIDLITTEALGTLPLLEQSAEIAKGLKIVALSHPKDEKLQVLLEERKIRATRQIYLGYAAIQIADQAIGESRAETTQNLRQNQFETVLGNIRFNADGSATYNPYALMQWDGKELLPMNGEGLNP